MALWSSESLHRDIFSQIVAANYMSYIWQRLNKNTFVGTLILGYWHLSHQTITYCFSCPRLASP